MAEEFEGSIELVARALETFEVPAGAIARFTEALRDWTSQPGRLQDETRNFVNGWLEDGLKETVAYFEWYIDRGVGSRRRQAARSAPVRESVR